MIDPIRPDHPLARRAQVAFGLMLAYLAFSTLLAPLLLPISFLDVALMDWQRLFELATLGLAILSLAPAAIAVRRAGLTMPQWEWSLPWLIFFALGAISSTSAVLPMIALLDWSWNLCWFIATALLVLLSPGSKAAFHRMVAVWVIVTVISYTLLFFTVNFEALFTTSLFRLLQFPGFNNVRPFTDYQTVVLFFIPVAIQTLVTARRWRACCWLLAGMYVSLALASGSRSLVLGQLAGLASIRFLWRQDRTEFFGQQLKMWILGAMSYLLMFVLIPLLVRGSMAEATGANDFLRFGTSARDVIWTLATLMFLDSPLLGQGPMHFAVFPNPVAASPHNHVLQLLAEWGGPATLIFVVMTGRFLMRAFAVVDVRASVTADAGTTHHGFQTAAGAALVALLAQSFVSPVFNNPASQILLSVLAALCAGRTEAARNAATRLMNDGIQRLALVALVVLIFAAWLVAPWIGRIAERNGCYTAAVMLAKANPTTVVYFPRFWQQGWIYLPCERIGKENGDLG